MSKFSGTEIEANLNHFHPFGSPVYALKENLKQQKSHNKWSDRLQVGIFICHSPFHASNVPLILNTQTVNVSPKFHFISNDELSTCKHDATLISLWQHKAKLKYQPQTEKVIDVLPIQQGSQPSQLPGATDPLPRFVEPCNSQPEMSSAEELPKNTL